MSQDVCTQALKALPYSRAMDYALLSTCATMLGLLNSKQWKMSAMPVNVLKLSAPAHPELAPGSPLWDDFIQCEWPKPREYSFTKAAGTVFYEIAYSLHDV